MFKNITDLSFTARIFKNSSWGIASNVLSACTGIFKIGLVTRALGAEQYGILVVITVFPTMMQQFTGFRTGEFVTRYCTMALEQGETEKAGNIALLGWMLDTFIAFLTIIAIIIGGRQYLFTTLGSVKVLPLLYIYSIVTLSNAALSTSQALLRVFDKFNWLFIQTACNSLVNLGLIFLVVSLELGLTGVVVSYTLACVLNSLVSLLFCIYQTGKHLCFVFRRSIWSYTRTHAREFISFLGAGYIEGTMLVISRNLDVVLLSNMWGPIEVGYYRIAYSMIGYLGSLISPLANAILPDMQRSVGVPLCVLKRRLVGLTAGAGSLFTLGATLTFLTAPWVVNIIIGPGFEQAVPAIQVMVWTVVISGGLFWLSALMLSLGRQWVRVLANSTAILSQTLLWWLLIPVYGYMGAAWAYLVLFLIFPIPMIVSLMLNRPNNTFESSH